MRAMTRGTLGGGQQLRWRVEVRESLREIHCAVGIGDTGHPANDGFAKVLGTAAG